MPDEVKVSVRHLRSRLSDHLRRVQQGESIVITVRNQRVARLVPCKPVPDRPFGFMKGQIRIADDFDQTPSDVLAAVDADLFSPRRGRRAKRTR